MIYRTSSAHEEGGKRDFAINTKSFRALAAVSPSSTAFASSGKCKAAGR